MVTGAGSAGTTKHLECSIQRPESETHAVNCDHRNGKFERKSFIVLLYPSAVVIDVWSCEKSVSVFLGGINSMITPDTKAGSMK
jgi:hypothetical protein